MLNSGGGDSIGKSFLSRISTIFGGDTKASSSIVISSPEYVGHNIYSNPNSNNTSVSSNNNSSGSSNSNNNSSIESDNSCDNNASGSNNGNVSYIPPAPPLPPNGRSPTPRRNREYSVQVLHNDWEGYVLLNDKMKVGEIWKKIKEVNISIDVPNNRWSLTTASLGLFDENGALLVEKELVVNCKLNRRSTLVVKPRPKKELGVFSFLNNFLSRRATKEELITKKIIPTVNTVTPPNPEAFKKCIEFMNRVEAYKLEGIFRVSASAVHMKDFYPTLESGDPDFSIVVGLHTVPASVKQYLRSFPYGLIGPPLSLEMSSVVKAFTGDAVAYELAKLIPKINKEYLQVIHLLFEFLLKVVQHQEISLMNEQNCSIVFGPSVISFYGTDVDVLSQSHAQSQLIYTFLTNYEQIFGPPILSLSYMM